MWERLRLSDEGTDVAIGREARLNCCGIVSSGAFRVVSDIGSWFFNNVSTCSRWSLVRRSRYKQRRHWRLTQSSFQQFHISSLGSALLSDLIVCTIVAQAFACSTSRSGAIAAQLSLPAQNTGDPLWPRLGLVLWYVIRCTVGV